MNKILVAGMLLAMLLCAGCSHVRYTPHSRREQQLAKPSIVLLDRIIEYREKFNEWPPTKDAFLARDIRYREAFAGFPYQEARFRINSPDEMFFVFTGHRQDRERSRTSSQVDLNAFGGEVRFYREGGRFLWKIRMY